MKKHGLKEGLVVVNWKKQQQLMLSENAKLEIVDFLFSNNLFVYI